MSNPAFIRLDLAGARGLHYGIDGALRELDKGKAKFLLVAVQKIEQWKKVFLAAAAGRAPPTGGGGAALTVL